jgi:sugar transferase (PEP-CTERM system associated)
VITPRAWSNRYVLMSGGDFLVATTVAYVCFRILGPVEYPAGVEYPLADTAPLLGLFFAILMYLSDSYALEYKDFARSASAVLMGGAITLSLSLSAMLVLALAERKLCLVTTTITTLCLILWRLALDRYVKRHVTRRVIILGNTKIGRILAREIDERWYLGNRFLGFVCPDQGGAAVGESPSLGQAGYFLSSLDSLVADRRPLTLVLDAGEGLPLSPEQLLKVRAMGVGVHDCESFYELITGKLPVNELRYSWLVFAPGYVRGRWRLATKRLIDIAAALAILALTLPIALIAAIAVKLDSPGPIFYQQDRLGMGGKVFRIFKFRSMRVDAETGTGAAWAAVRDPRVTHVGRLMRLLRIDELPQLINVLKGEMSLVGPRPERPEIIARLIPTMPLYNHRHSMRPGLSGWAQVCYQYGATVEDTQEKLCYDLYYIKNWSLLLDLQIMLQTLKVVLYGRGAR